MHGTRKEVPLPNLRVYRYAWAVAFVLAAISLFTLGTPGTPALSDEPRTFDGKRAMLDLETLATEYTGRVAGSSTDAGAAVWLVQAFQRLGLETHIDTFAATLSGRNVALQNVWAVARGTAAGSIVIVANRDSPPRSTQGADANGSGTATLLELARVFTVTGHQHTLIFLSSDGDAYGGLGADRYVERYGVDDVLAVVALRRTASRDADGLAVDGWGPAARVAPPWLWLLSERASRGAGGLDANLPRIPGQVLRLAVPTSSGSQAPFVAAGAPALSLSAGAPAVDPVDDTMDNVSEAMLTRVGRTAETLVLSVDGALAALPGSGGTTFLRRDRTLPGVSLTLLLIALFVPLAAVTTDLFAQCRRRRVRLGPGWGRPRPARDPVAGRHHLDLLLQPRRAPAAQPRRRHPAGVGARRQPQVPPRRRHRRRLDPCLRVRDGRRAPSRAPGARRPVGDGLRRPRRPAADRRAVFFVNPYSLLLVAPAAVIWPLARPGTWTRSILPVYLGLR